MFALCLAHFCMHLHLSFLLLQNGQCSNSLALRSRRPISTPETQIHAQEFREEEEAKSILC